MAAAAAEVLLMVMAAVVLAAGGEGVVSSPASSTVATVTSGRVIDVAREFGITQPGIAQALQLAGGLLNSHATEDSDVELFFQAGAWNIVQGDAAGFVLDGVTGRSPTASGRLILAGAGINQTTLVFTNRDQDTILGHNVQRLTVRDLHFARNYTTVTQGYVAEIGAGYVDLDIHDGFPTPGQLFSPSMTIGRFLRQFTDSKTDPHMVNLDNGAHWPPLINAQYPWLTTAAVPGHARRWRMQLKDKVRANYTLGVVLGVKSKTQGQAYQLFGGNDVVFENVKWTETSRGVTRNINNVRFSGCMVLRGPPIGGRVPCMATPAGGPQLDADAGTAGLFNVTVENHYSVATGDDSVALFNLGHNATVRGCFIRDSYARGILLANASAAVVENNTLIRNPLWNTGPLGVGGQGD